MWKTLLALAAVILSVGITAHLISGAYAEPRSSLGNNPAASFGGILSSSSQTILTAPTDQTFIVKTLITDSVCDIYLDGVLHLSQNSYFSPAMYWFHAGNTNSSSQGTAFTQGTANLVVPAGTSFAIHNCNSSRFYIDGYYVHP